MEKSCCKKAQQAWKMPKQVRQLTHAINYKGFTLIELLVVVLIIGVLAAIALPMYQKAVLKSRFAALMPIGKSLSDSNEAYYLEHNAYASDPQDLLVQGQEEYGDDTEVALINERGLAYVVAYNEDRLPGNKYAAFQKHSENFAGTTICEAADDAAGQICEAFGGTLMEEGGLTKGWSAYLLTGDATGSSFPSFCPEHAVCDNNAQVLECTDDYHGANCDETCEEGYSYNGSACCPANSTCNNSGSVTGCAPGYYISGNECVAQATRTEACSYSTSCRNLNYTGGSGSMCIAGSDGGYGIGYGTCSNSTFSASGVNCYGYHAYGCSKTTYTGVGSYCRTDYWFGCAGSTFYGGTYCTANSDTQGCKDTIYLPNKDGVLGCCNGSTCPVGSPSCAYGENTGWKVVWQGDFHGDCCNPATVGGAENCGSMPQCS